MRAQCIRAASVAELEMAVARAHFSPTLGLVFASVAVDIEALARMCDRLLFPVIGASSCGEFISCDPSASHYGHSSISEGGIVCLLLDLNPGAFDIRLFPATQHVALGRDIADWAMDRYSRPGLVLLGAGLALDGEQVVEGVKARSGTQMALPIFGGLAGDDSRFERTFAFTSGASLDHGVAALVLDTDRVEMTGVAASGWSGVGAWKTVTHAEGNRVYTLDNRPAMDVYTHYLGIQEDDLPQIGVDYPLLVRRSGHADEAPVLRAVMSVDRQTRALGFAGAVPQGGQVQFSSCPGPEVIKTTQAALDRLHEAVPEAEVALMFSCMARHLALGPEVEAEIRHAAGLWQVPLAGFFTYGEIGPAASGSINRQCAFHNETLSLLLLREK